MKVHVRLFASLRERVPGDPREHRGRVSIDLQDDASLQSVLDHFDISRRLSQMVLINGQQASRERSERLELALHDGDTVSVFPPLAGG